MSKNTRITTIGVIGPSEFHCSNEIYDFAFKLGKMIADMGYTVVCGGLGGTMEAVCKGAHSSEKYKPGMTIGILPSADKSTANEFVDIVIPTGLGFARNTLVVNSADVVVALGGGSGTLSEIAFAWQMHRPIICFDGFDGWSKELADRKLDERREKPIFRASSLEEIRNLIEEILS